MLGDQSEYLVCFAAALLRSTNPGFAAVLDARLMFSFYAVNLFAFEFVDLAKYLQSECPHLESKESARASCQPNRPPSICAAALSSDSSFLRKYLFGWPPNAF